MHYPRFVVLATFVALSLPASAQVFQESGDAGHLLGIAQVVDGMGALTTITGTIGSGTDVDLFRIFISSPATFSATTLPGTSVDAQLFLFNAAGLGVIGNDDFFGLLPALTPGTPFSPITPGIYYLAVSPFNIDPVSAGGFIFPPVQAGLPPFGPTGPGGNLPLSGYSGAGGAGTYAIRLTGTDFAGAMIPEPGTIALVGIGLLPLAGIAARRRRKA